MPTIEEIDALYDAAPGPSGTTGGGDIIDQLYDAAPGPTSVGDVVSGGVQNLGNALTFGFLDEASAGVNTGLDALGALVTGKAGLSDVGRQAGGVYDEYLNKARGQRQTFRDAAGPGLAYGQDIGAMLLMPQKLFGDLKSVGGAIKGGAEAGALYGFGEGEGGATDRAINAALGAGLGGAVGGAAGAVGAGISKAADTRWGQAVMTELRRLGADETGAVMPSGRARQGLTPAQAQLLQRVRNLNPGQIANAATALERAQQLQIPMTLTEALDAPAITRQARALANYEPSMQTVNEFIASRTAEAPERISTILGDVAPAESAATAGEKLRSGAEAVKDAINRERAAAVEPLFYRAENINGPVRPFGEQFSMMRETESPEIKRLLQTNVLKPLANESRNVIAAQRGIPEEAVSQNSVAVVQDVLERLGAKIKAAEKSSSPESPRVTRDWQVIKKKLEGLVADNEPGLHAARVEYAKISEAIKDPTDAQLKVLTSIKDMQLEKAGESLMKIPPDQITPLREAFEKNGQGDAFKAGVRAYFQNILDSLSGGEGRNVDIVHKMIGNKQIRQRLEAALGKDEAGQIINRLGVERHMHQGTQALHPGSSTAGNLAEQKALTESKSMLGKLFQLGRHPVQSIDRLIDAATTSQLDDVLANELARTYIADPAKGLADLRAIQALQAERFPAIRDAAKLEALLQEFGGRVGGRVKGPKTNGGGNGGSSDLSGFGEYPPDLIVSPQERKAPQKEARSSKTQSRGSRSTGETGYQASALLPLALFGSDQGSAAGEPTQENSLQTLAFLDRLFGGGNDKTASYLPNALFGSKKNDMNPKYETVVAKVMPALFEAESGGDPNAVSKAGAKGLGQLLDSTGREWHKRLGLPGKYDPFNAEQNAKIATEYYAWLLEQLKGDAKLALAAYNHGIGNVKDKMARWGKDFKSIYPRLPAETQAYVKRITRDADIA